MDKKSFKSLAVGDYIYRTADTMPGIWEVFRVVNIYEQYGETHFELTWFGDDADYVKSTEDEHLIISLKDNDIEKDRVNDTSFSHYYQTWVDCGQFGVGKYIHNQTKKEYSLIQENLKEKRFNRQTNTYNWEGGMILYKAEYHNEDGPYFVRTKDDFYKSFTKIG